MSAIDERLVCMRLVRNWLGKVEKDEIELNAAWELLVERVNAIVHVTCPTCGMTPCPDPAFCQSCRTADEKIAAKIAARRCAQCGAAGDLDPHQDKERKRIVYLHGGSCARFWKAKHG